VPDKDTGWSVATGAAGVQSAAACLPSACRLPWLRRRRV